MVLEQMNTHRPKPKHTKKPQPTSQLYIKTNSKWITDFNVICETIKLLLKEKHRRKSFRSRTRQKVLDLILKA